MERRWRRDLEIGPPPAHLRCDQHRGLAKPGKPPALYIGTGDNDSFVSLDGGQTWRDCAVHLGDADAWFSDLAQSTRVLQFAPSNRGGDGLEIWSGDYPDASDRGAKRGIPTPNSAPPGMGPDNVVAGFVERGYSPIVRTLATEPAPADGDYVLIMAQSDGMLALKRTLAISSITKAADWEDPAISPQRSVIQSRVLLAHPEISAQWLRTRLPFA